MGAFQQAALPVQVTTPLGADKLLVQNFWGEEFVSGLFHYHLELISQDMALDFSGIVGKTVTMAIPQSSGDKQYFNGVVGQFMQAGSDARFAYYVAEVFPWLWQLTLNANCRIFQNQAAPDIVKKVFSDAGFTDFKDQLTGTYKTREFCVQYRETDFAFVSRLMEEEGIFYFFTHTSSVHTLVLADDSSAWTATTGLTAARFTADPRAWTSDDVVKECNLEQTVTSGQYQTDDYNFETPSTDLAATASGADTSRSIYDYPGLYTKQSDGETVAGLRLSALEWPGNTLRGAGLCRAFRAGSKFTLSGHYRASANTGYVLRAVRFRGNQEEYSNNFEAFPATATYRPPLVTRRPAIGGGQTALVVGKSGEEIWTDQYGRVKVKFYWDQSSATDETCSCWIRVAHPWAGKQWGAIYLPRIGQEVVVTFMEGNPDRPLITGSVYNAEQTVPYTLPDDQTKSTVKSNSSKGGGGFNELRFEDKAGSEEVFIQAQKDMNVTVLNDQTTTITNARAVTIQKADDALTVSQGNRTLAIQKGNESVTVQGTRTLSVTGNESHTNKADYSSTVSGNYTLKVSGNLSIEVSGSVSIKAGTSLTNQSGTDMTNEAGTTLTNKAAASQTVDGGGLLTLKGGLVKIN